MDTSNALHALHTCNSIKDTHTNIKTLYTQMDKTMNRMNSKLDEMDDLLKRFNNRNQENRPSCIPGFYKTAKYIPIPPSVPITNASATAAGTAHNAVRAIRSNHYR